MFCMIASISTTLFCQTLETGVKSVMQFSTIKAGDILTHSTVSVCVFLKVIDAILKTQVT